MKIIKLKKFSWNTIILLIFFILFYFPIFLMLTYSFSFSQTEISWNNFSFYWYIILFKDEKLLYAIETSILIAILSATLSVIIGIIASVIITKHNKNISNILSFIFTASLLIPDVIMGVAFLLFFITLSKIFSWTENGILLIWIAHTVFCTSYTIVIMSAKLRDKNFLIFENAAVNLGANPLKSFFLISIPLLSPSIAASWLLSFSLSLDDLIIASFVTRPGITTLPIKIFAMVRRGINPEINAVAAIILLFISFIGLIIWKIFLKQNTIKYLR